MIDLSHLRLAQLGFGVRFGLTLFCVMITAGYAAGLWFMTHHVAQKDGDPELEWIDLVGTYHGVDKPAPLLAILEEPTHRAYLQNDEEVEVLMKWLRGGDQGERPGADLIGEGYDAGDLPPADVLYERCLSCHTPQPGDASAVGNRIPLHDLPAVKAVAYRKTLDALSTDILAVSSHTHFLSIPTFSILIFGLFLLTGWLRFLRHGIFALGMLGLTADFAGMWLARYNEDAVYLIVGGGALYGACLGLAILAIVLELWVAPYLRGAHQPPPEY